MNMFLVIGPLYVALSFLLTSENADGLLAGYNTLSTERKKRYNIKAIVRCINLTLRYTGIATLLCGLLSLCIDFNQYETFIFLLSTIPLVTTNIYTRLKYSTDPIRLYEWILNGILIIGMLVLAFISLT